MSAVRTFRACLTIYALTAGIEDFEVDLVRESPKAMARRRPDGLLLFLGDEGRDWHRTREAAVARAEAMRAEEIASLREQIARLEALSFDEEKP